MIILDTCSWFKVRSLQKSQVSDLLPILYQSDLWATHELLKEYRYHLKDFLDLSKLSVLHVDITFMREFVGAPLDAADLSLIEFGRRNPHAAIISDDGDALSNCYLFNSLSFQLADFALWLASQSVISKREAYHIIKKLCEWKNIQKSHHNKLSQQLQTIR